MSNVKEHMRSEEGNDDPGVQRMSRADFLKKSVGAAIAVMFAVNTGCSSKERSQEYANRMSTTGTIKRKYFTFGTTVLMGRMRVKLPDSYNVEVEFLDQNRIQTKHKSVSYELYEGLESGDTVEVDYNSLVTVRTLEDGTTRTTHTGCEVRGIRKSH